jgi:hypothetical protein
MFGSYQFRFMIRPMGRNPADRQATVWVEITDTTLRVIPDILDPSQDGYHDTDLTSPHPRAISALP